MQYIYDIEFFDIVYNHYNCYYCYCYDMPCHAHAHAPFKLVKKSVRIRIHVLT